MNKIWDVTRRGLLLATQLPVYFYKYAISPWLPNRCRFYPSCSDYCLQALEKHGVFVGLFLSARRLLSCHPFSKHSGFDPVPPHPYKCNCLLKPSPTPDTKTDGIQ